MAINNVVYGDPIYSDAASKYNITSIDYVNCSTTQQSVTETLSVGATKRSSVSMKRTVTNSIGVSVQVKFGFNWIVQGDATIKMDAKHTVALANGYSETFEERVTRTTTIPLKVPPMSKVVLEAVIAEYPGHVPFQAHLIADGNVIQNLENVTRASQALGPSARAIVVDGVLEAVGVSELKVRTYQYELEENTCPTSGGGISRSVNSIEIDGAVKTERRVLMPPAENQPAQRVNPGEKHCVGRSDLGAVCSVVCPAGKLAVCKNVSGGLQPNCSCQQ